MSTTLPPGWLCLVFLLVLHSFSVHKIVSEASCATLNYCSGHGKCTVDSKCVCDEGWGAAIDVTNYRSSDCSARTCPAGVSWGDLPATNATGFLSAHRVAECSDRGICDRSTGVCRCDQDFTGKACERTRCPNDCSGHGQCLSMMRLANTTSALPLSAGVKYQYNVRHKTFTSEVFHLLRCEFDKLLVRQPSTSQPGTKIRYMGVYATLLGL